MGAFDGLNFYQTCIGANESKDLEPQPISTFYVSWKQRNGVTGQHFDYKLDADKCFDEKKQQGLKPAKWYKD